METPKIPMNVIEIQKLIPHRYPFLFVDRVIELVPHEKIVAIRNVTISDPMLQGHFPNNPIVPGVVLVEGAAQAATLLGSVSKGGCQACLFTEISNARFRKPVVPGDVIHYNVTLKRTKSHFFWFEASLTVDGEQAVEVEFSAMMK
ncbi:MAG: 3-hydroxyacyl-ACP dehydratase FabZ [Proteobacteria bacterium]|nr:3-hydroxyacyl-ACP dehydratase FabZ [Pseudomonadota bacterium]